MRFACQLLVARDAERLGGLGHVEEVVRDPGPLFGGRLGRADVHPPVHEHRVDRDDLGAEALGDRDRRLGLARRRSDRRARGAAVRHRSRRARPSPDGGRLPLTASSPSRWCGWAPTIRTSRNVPGACSPPTCTTRLRPRPAARAALAPDALDQHLGRRADLLAHPLERDRLLERDQPVEPLLDHGLVELLVHRRRRASPAGASTGTCTPGRTAPAERRRACPRSPPRSRRGTPR